MPRAQSGEENDTQQHAEEDVVAQCRRSHFSTSDKNRFHSTLYPPLTSLARFPPHHFFIKSSTAPLIALTPVRTVGSGTGANSLECGPGSRVPFSLASFNFCAS